MIIISLSYPFEVDLKTMQLKLLDMYLNFKIYTLQNELWAYRGHLFVLPILVMPKLFLEKVFALSSFLWSCLSPHNYKNVGSQMTHHTCLQCLNHRLLKCKIGNSNVATHWGDSGRIGMGCLYNNSPLEWTLWVSRVLLVHALQGLPTISMGLVWGNYTEYCN